MFFSNFMNWIRTINNSKKIAINEYFVTEDNIIKLLHEKSLSATPSKKLPKNVETWYFLAKKPSILSVKITGNWN